MSHGDSLQGFNRIQQAALAIPAPGKENQYYVFTLGLSLGKTSTSLFYTLVDMHLEGGLGDVVVSKKNQLLGDTYANQLTAVPHANGQDYWVLVRQWDAAIFDTYLVSSAGVKLAHTQRIGPTTYARPTYLDPAVDGFLKASPDGKKLACTVSSYPELSLFVSSPLK